MQLDNFTWSSEMSTRLSAIRDACEKPPDMRTDENINVILDFVRDVKFFAKLSPLQQRTLCRMMTIESFAPRENIFEIGDVGDKFYIILTGMVTVQVPSPDAPCPNGVHSERCDCTNRPLETGAFLEKGQSFGELALQEDAPRSATIVTNEATEVLVTTRADYEEHAGERHRLFIEQRSKFLRRCPFISEALELGALTPKDVSSIAGLLNEKSFNGNEIIVRQGEPVEHMIFVISGSLAMMKVIDLDQVPSRRRPGTSTKQVVETPQDPREGSPKSSSRKSSKAEVSKVTSRTSSKSRRKATKDRCGDDDDEDSTTKDDAPVTFAKARLVLKHQEREKRRLSLSPCLASADSKQPVRKSVMIDETFNEIREGPQLWAKVRSICNQATMLTRLSETYSEDHSRAPVSSASIDRALATVVLKRQQSREQAVIEEVAPPNQQEAPVPSKPKRPQILRIGTIGAYQYFGDKQVCNGEGYPCSLVCDPIAEVYTMSKHDILRRLPKKLLSTLFNQENQVEPNDSQLLDMFRQTERWFAYRRNLHGEAIMHKNQERSRIYRASAIPAVDALANLEFLGVNPNSEYAKRMLPPPQVRGVHLTSKDEELFSQTSARGLRRFEAVKRDRGLHLALARAGRLRRTKVGMAEEDLAADFFASFSEEHDPMAIRFDQHWSKLGRGSIALGLDIDLDSTPVDVSRFQSHESKTRPGATKLAFSSCSPPSLMSSYADGFGVGSCGSTSLGSTLRSFRSSDRPGTAAASVISDRPPSSNNCRFSVPENLRSVSRGSFTERVRSVRTG